MRIRREGERGEGNEGVQESGKKGDKIEMTARNASPGCRVLVGAAEREGRASSPQGSGGSAYKVG